MSHSFSRRHLLATASFAIPTIALGFESGTSPAKSDAAGLGKSTSGVVLPADFYPAQAPDLVREMVTVSHYNLARVKELVGAHPSLAKASWDWGFGDWESALGAASHMGNRPIAEFLLSNGAHSSIFSAAMLGQLDVVKASVVAQPGIQRIAGPHSISLLAHAEQGGANARPVLEFLQSLGDADASPQAPLPDEVRSAILGTYVFGSGPSQKVDVTFEKGKLIWTRKGTVGRFLFHLGDQVFYPSGAPAVRIRFTEDQGSRVMTVNDSDIVLVGKMSR